MLVLSRDVLGVVLFAGPGRHELSVWPCARLQVDESDLRHLTPFDACARMWSGQSDTKLVEATALNRCRPRARDGRCHWCSRDLDSSDEDAGEWGDP